MAEKNANVNTPIAKEAETVKAKGVSAQMVMAARLKRAQDMGILTPKMQRGFDRMATNSMKGGK